MEQQGRVVDVHVFEFDQSGKNIYGVEYPSPREKDLSDVEALSTKYGFEIPITHRRRPGQA